MVSGNGTIEKRETPQPQIYQYLINVGKKIKVEFELPYNVGSLEDGQKVKVSIRTTKPKKKQPLLTLRGEVYQIKKVKTGKQYTVFFSGLQGTITVKRSIPRARVKKALYLSISD